MRPPAVVSVAPPSVLVIDDEELLRRALVRGLRRRYTVTELRDAESALSLIAGGSRFDAIVSDLHLTGMSGREFFRSLGLICPQQATRVILLSGSFDEDDYDDCGRSTPLLVEKPVSMQTLQALVAEIMRDAPRAA